MIPEVPHLPETLEECHDALRTAWFLIHRHHLYVGGKLWNEGHSFYREDGLLYSRPTFREGLSVIIVNRDEITLMGTVTAWGDIATTIDKAGDGPRAR